MVLTLSPSLATTTCDLVGWLGVRLGLLKPATPARSRRGSFLLATLLLGFHLSLLCFDLPASDKAIATACLRDLTTGPPLPECRVPLLNSPITLASLVFFTSSSHSCKLHKSTCSLFVVYLVCTCSRTWRTLLLTTDTS